MPYTVLARKYRSQTFDDVVGQDPIAKTLENAIKTGRVAHAYLFAGTRGVGKTTMARILAKALNCLAFDAPTTKPCCKCDSCLAVSIGEDIDVIEIDGATNNGVEQVRELRQNAIYRPARSRYKIYVIDEVHMLSVPAFNALLKTLEEPPEHVKFIFATTEPNKVIPTIQSRCQRFDFNNINPTLIAAQLKYVLKEEKVKYEEDLVLPLAKMANGSMRDALSLLDRLISTGAELLTVGLLEEFLGCANSEKIYNLVAEIGSSSAAGTLNAVESLISTGLSEVQIVDSLIDCMRDLLVVKSAGPESQLLVLTSHQRDRTVELAQKFDIAGLVYNITTLERIRWSVKNSDTARALLDASLLRFALSEHFLNVDSLLSQLQSEPVKKKLLIDHNATFETTGIPVKTETDKKAEQPLLSDLESVKNNWQNVLRIISEKLGPSVGGLLSSAEPTQFENGLLTLAFDASKQMHKKMCENNGRVEAIQSLLSEHFSTPVKLKLETATEERLQQPGTDAQKKNRIAGDPAVKTVLIGLDATIIGIEEEKKS